MTRLTLILLCTALAACGVDGEPVAPQVNGSVTINQNGIYPSASVGVGKGPISVWLGL
ncbi:MULTISPECIES: hypothetical protein [unclassified Roseobacter]|uniref:hypothetical protein n=1 Tax=unclassified Roseobacter TaxID=196798 RepID=UPI0018A2DB85|nr:MULTISPECIES: hypothetical protein [unclassified Roseobacter]MDW3183043.1 hypothetical protein [Roseobacter sp.]